MPRSRATGHDAAIKRLARVEDISFAEVAPKGAAQMVIGEATACLPLGSLIDLDAEKNRLEKAQAKNKVEIDRIVGKLGNEKFVANAKPEVVEAERERLAELEREKANLQTALKRISEV